jgi:molybdenum cofactor biosynthesis protein MoaC
MKELNHFDEQGNAVMVDVSGKEVTAREALAVGKIFVGWEIYEKISRQEIAKGDVLGVARLAGIMAMKKTSELIPLCHPLPLTQCRLDLKLCEEHGRYAVEARCLVKTAALTGVEMEVLTGVQIALLTIYDMCKAVDKGMEIGEVHLLRKSGGKSGDFQWQERGEDGIAATEKDSARVEPASSDVRQGAVGVVRALCISEKRGTPKRSVPEVRLLVNHGIENDAHAGKWHRQVSLLSYEQVEAFNARGAQVGAGAFGENVLLSGLELSSLPVGTRLRCGELCLCVTQIGKECHSHCQIYQRVGDCIMPREGIFAVVEQGGALRVGDELRVEPPAVGAPFRAAVITLSDKGARGERVDTSGPRAAELLREAGYVVEEQFLLPDERGLLEQQLKRLADSRQVDLVLTTGGTGMAERDVTPEATLAVATRLAPGIAEAIRAGSLAITPRAMLSRGVAVLRGRTLIVNLPGSRKAVEEALAIVLPQLAHALGLLRGTDGECGRV